jgi:hypothetical protein
MTRALQRGARTGGAPGWVKRINSHESFTHDSIDSLGYDWERVADPAIAPRYPRKIHLPRTTEDVVDAVREARALGEHLVVRSKGHSSNDLVVSERGVVLLTEKLNGILAVDTDSMTATLQGGAVSAQVDDTLAEQGLGLPVIGDHNHITVGGFASVGGISPASHRYGMFVDTVQSLEYVTWDGELVACDRVRNCEQFYAVLAGQSRHGIIVTLTVRIIRVDKYGTVLKNDQRHHRNVDRFIETSARMIRDPGDALMERGVWVDFGRFGVGQFSAYRPTAQSRYARLRDRIAYTALHGIGAVAGRLPHALDVALKYVGMTGVLLSPKYASVKNVEFFSDKILDSTVGDPMRMFVVLAPVERFEEIFRAAHALMREFRDRHGCFTFVSAYVKAITSEYLAQGRPDQNFCELLFYNGIAPQQLPPDLLEELVTRLDDICIAHDAFRYMHSRTSKDPQRRTRVDPNAHYTQAVTGHTDRGATHVP